jgi:hypothetical protein
LINEIKFVSSYAILIIEGIGVAAFPSQSNSADLEFEGPESGDFCVFIP